MKTVFYEDLTLRQVQDAESQIDSAFDDILAALSSVIEDEDTLDTLSNAVTQFQAEFNTTISNLV